MRNAPTKCDSNLNPRPVRISGVLQRTRAVSYFRVENSRAPLLVPRMMMFCCAVPSDDWSADDCAKVADAVCKAAEHTAAPDSRLKSCHTQHTRTRTSHIITATMYAATMKSARSSVKRRQDDQRTDRTNGRAINGATSGDALKKRWIHISILLCCAHLYNNRSHHFIRFHRNDHGEFCFSSDRLLDSFIWFIKDASPV